MTSQKQEFRKTVSLLAEDGQIIYTTHSPFMVGTDELDLVQIIEATPAVVGRSARFCPFP